MRYHSSPSASLKLNIPFPFFFFFFASPMIFVPLSAPSSSSPAAAPTSLRFDVFAFGIIGLVVFAVKSVLQVNIAGVAIE
jgi:hypothetical protein